jgi:hypothetical protein
VVVSDYDQRIFISYRREDAQGYAGWLQESLAEWFPPSQIFRDIASIPEGANYSSVITNALRSCDVALVMIGPQWTAVRDVHGQHRLSHPDDWVRLEIEAALDSSRTRVIPLLFNGAQVPAYDEVPASIHKLLAIQVFRLEESDFRSSVRRLASTIADRSDQAGPTRTLGAEQERRDALLKQLIRLHESQIKSRVTVPLYPWQTAAALRGNMLAVIDALEPEEEVVNLALGDFGSALTGLVALTPRRVIWSALGEPAKVESIRFDKVLALHKRAILKYITITLSDNNVDMFVAPRSTNTESHKYMRERVGH